MSRQVHLYRSACAARCIAVSLRNKEVLARATGGERAPYLYTKCSVRSTPYSVLRTGVSRAVCRAVHEPMRVHQVLHIYDGILIPDEKGDYCASRIGIGLGLEYHTITGPTSQRSTSHLTPLAPVDKIASGVSPPALHVPQAATTSHHQPQRELSPISIKPRVRFAPPPPLSCTTERNTLDV